jgi:YesN/AraC family two-component response regulator
MELFGLGDCHMVIPKGLMTIYNCLIDPDYFFKQLGKEWFSPDVADKQSRNPQAVTFRKEQKEEVERLLHCMLLEYQNRTENYTEVITSLLKSVLIHFRNAQKVEISCLLPQLENSQETADEENDLIRIAPKLFQYIEENFQKKIFLKDVAKVGFYNPNYFSSYFKKNFGRTLTDFIQFKRYLSAMDYMVNTNLTLDEISIRVGYSDRKLFYKIIRHYSGMLPSRCRELLRSQYKNFDSFKLNDKNFRHHFLHGA